MSDVSTAASAPASVIVIGAGPRGAGWLERFVENQRQLGVSDVTVHLVDPFPPGPGRIWRYDQSPLLKLNSLAEDVTMFTDESSTIEGPVVAGPSLAEWARDVRAGIIDDVTTTDERLAAELAVLGPKSFPTRRLQSLYLDWFHRRTLGRLPAGTTVVTHRDRAVAVDDLPDGRQRVELASGGGIVGDLVVHALGHSGSEPPAESAGLAAFADRHGLFYLPPSYTADTDLSALGAGEPLIVRGLGLSAVDLLVLLGEGRGGRFERSAAGERLRYVPSGREPRILIGSRRGIPYHSKITSTLAGTRPVARYFTPDIAAGLATDTPALDFTEHVWPLIAKEMLHGYYAELFTGHRSRVLVSWEEFADRFDPLDPFGDDLRALAAETVIDPGDRLDLDRFDRPLAGVGTVSTDDLQTTIRAYIENDMARRALPEHSATLGLFQSLLQSLFAFVGISDSPNWTALSRERDLDGWWFGFFSYVASGPPGPRLEEILALSEAGVVTFLGSDLVIEAVEGAGVFTARGANLGGEVTARALVDAWLPTGRVATSDNPVLRQVVDAGVGVEQVVSDASYTTNTGKLTVRREDARITRPDGSVHPRRFAIGPYTTSPFVGAFSRPRTNALAFRENDAVARAVLGMLAGPGAPAPAPVGSLRAVGSP